MGKMFLNIINRADSGEDFEGFQFQQEVVHKLGLKATILVPFTSMKDQKVMDYVRSQKEKYGDEVGIHFHLLVCEEFTQLFDSWENAIYLQTRENKKRILTHVFERFRGIFGFIPSAIGGYYFDAWTLSWIKENYPEVKVSIVSCFEEGTHMFAGTDHSWMLFSNGGHWGTYYPSRESSLCPAINMEEAIDIVALPHLNRDMVLSLTGRNDFFASHPGNVIRGKANEGSQSTYLKKFIDQWISQVDYNGYEYYSYFISPPWVMEGKLWEENYIDSRMLYIGNLEYLKMKQEEGLVSCVTMSEYSNWFRKNIKPQRCEINHWKDILCGSERELFWYIDSEFRMTIDPNLGGAITDIRPYAGRVDKNLGPDTKNLYNGIYPFLISYDHRAGTAGGTIHTCEISYGGHKIDLSEKRTACRVENKDENGATIVMEPMDVQLGDLNLTVMTTYKFTRGEGLLINRKIGKLSIPRARVKFIEIHRGSYGTTEYPEDMRGIVLSLEEEGGCECIEYKYAGRLIKSQSTKILNAYFPNLNINLRLQPINGCDQGSVIEGILFKPYYTLQLEKNLGEGEVFEACLKIRKG